MKVILVGYSGHGYVAADILLNDGNDIIGYCDNEQKVKNPFNLPYLGTELQVLENEDLQNASFFVSIGDIATREKVFQFLKSKNASIINALHPKAVVAQHVMLGRGVFVAANATVNPLCTIGDGVICNTSSSIDHECTIGDFSHICPGTVLCGNVNIGKRSFIGANSVVKPGVTIGDKIIIGAGSTVLNDVQEPGIYFGDPARLKSKS